MTATDAQGPIRREPTIGDVAVERIVPGTPVLGSSGDLGVVVGLREDPASGGPAYLLVREPHLLWLGGAIRIVPISLVKSATSELVVLDADLDRVRRFPPVREAWALARDVVDAIAGVEILRPFRLGISVEVHDATVDLSGNVRTVVQKKVAEAAAGNVDGVLAVRNRLVDDETLTVEVAHLLAEDPTLRQAHLKVYCNLGRIVLSGRLPSPSALRTAIDLARAVPGVLEVRDDIEIVPQSPEAPPPTAAG